MTKEIVQSAVLWDGQYKIHQLTVATQCHDLKKRPHLIKTENVWILAQDCGEDSGWAGAAPRCEGEM